MGFLEGFLEMSGGFRAAVRELRELCQLELRAAAAFQTAHS
jgi:hypothetical protein